MPSRPKTTVAPDLKEAAFATLQKIQREQGLVSNADVRRAAVVMQVDVRTVRRMLARGYVRKPREVWTPSEGFTSLLVQGQGSVATIHRRLTESGEEPGCSVRTMQRYAAQHYDQRILAGARGGYEALRAGLPTMDRYVEHINDEWAMDHTKLPIWVLMPDGTVDKPWMTTIIDAASRMILATTIGPDTPSTEEDVETVAVAGVGFVENDVRIGGQPKALRSDRGGDLVSRAMTIGLISQGTQRVYAEAYHPNQNGLIERWHRTIKEDLVPFVAGRDRTKWTPSDPRKESVPPSADQLLPLESLQQKAAVWMRYYNFERPHRGLDDKTPFQRWAEDDAQIEPMDEQAIRAAMTQEITRVVSKGRVKWDKRFYSLGSDRVDPADEDSDRWRARLEGKKVIVRFLPARYEYVEVYTADGQYATKAICSHLLDPEDAADQAADRRAATKTLRTSLEDIAEQEKTSKQALLREAQGDAQADEDDAAFGARHPNPQPAKRPRSETPAAKRRKEKAEARAAEVRTEHRAAMRARTGTDDFF